jgi:hypothetical protein
VVIASLMSSSATGVGLVAAAIAVGGFLAHAGPALSGADEQRLRKATVRGGIGGIVIAACVILLSVLADY